VRPFELLAPAIQRLAPAAILMLPACSAVEARGGGYCAPPVVAPFSFVSDPEPPAGAPRAARMAALLGVSGVSGLSRPPAGEAPQSVEARVRTVERVEMADLAIAATSAELECESERAEQAADYLTRRQAKNVQLLTIGSVAAATLTGIAGVFLSTHQASAADQDAFAISGGVATATLGLASLFVHARANFEHGRNLLTDVWTGPPAPITYPPFVWSYLTRPEFSNGQREPIREKIVARWRRFGQVDDPDAASLLFGKGGSYDADTLRTRAAMLDEVRAEVELSHQDLLAFAATTLL
jgi:hypothetical protein